MHACMHDSLVFCLQKEARTAKCKYVYVGKTLISWDHLCGGNKNKQKLDMTRPPQNRVCQWIKDTRKIPWTNSQAWTYKIKTRQVQNKSKISFPRGLAPWANAKKQDLFCTCLVFILYVQAWLFVHGIFLVSLIHWQTLFWGGRVISNFCLFLFPPHRWSQLINVFPTYTYLHLAVLASFCKQKTRESCMHACMTPLSFVYRKKREPPNVNMYMWGRH